MPADLFTAPAAPIDITVTLDAATVSGDIVGPDGGTITSTGPDGTIYTLTVPAGALMFGQQVTMTPLSDVSGLPSAAAPANRLGVQLAPDGLELALPATLKIQPPALPADAALSTLSYDGSGQDAGLTLFRQDAGVITLEVEHFSGYSAFWPVDAEWWRVAERLRQSKAEQRLANAIAAELGKMRAAENLDPRFGTLELLLEYLPVWDRDVIRPALERAHIGCEEASHAVAAYFGWYRQLQILEIRDPRLERPIPPELLVLKRDLCFEEQFQRCRQTGDFEGLAGFFLAFLTQYQLLATEPTQDDVDLVILYLERCGIWDVVVENVDEGRGTGNIGRYHIKQTYRVKWAPGDAMYGLHGSRARSEDGRLEVLHYSITVGPPPASCPGAVFSGRDYRFAEPGWVEILHLGFDRSPSGDAIPREVHLEIGWGSVAFEHTGRCRNTANEGSGEFLIYSLAASEFGFGPHDGSLIDGEWVFDAGPFGEGPFSAKMVATHEFQRDTGELEVTITHVPAP